MTASTRSRRAFSAGRKSRMPRGGFTDATGLLSQVRLRRPHLGLETAQTLAEPALGIPPVRPGGRGEREERIAELGLRRRSVDELGNRGGAGNRDADLCCFSDELLSQGE